MALECVSCFRSAPRPFTESNLQESRNCELFSLNVSEIDQLYSQSKYSDSGWFTCQLYPGSYMNEERYGASSLVRQLIQRLLSTRDIKIFQEDWGFDLLKYV